MSPSAILRGVSTDGELELDRWQIRFASRHDEARFREWNFARSERAIATSLWPSVALWFVTLSLLYFFRPSLAFESTVAIGLVLASIVASFVALGRRRALTFEVVTAVSMSIAGTVGVLLATVVGSAHAPGIAAAVAATFYQFRLPYVRPWVIGLAALPQIVLALDFVANELSVGALSTAAAAIETLLLIFAYGVGLVGALRAARSMRRSYRQQRIIERQRETIEAERARNEQLLRQELGHQIAARSRELGRMLARADATLVPGRPRLGERFDTRYRVVREIGAGAMGAVFEVVRVTDDERLALKIVTGAVSSERAARFAREAEIGARMRHSNLIEIVDVGVADGGVPYLAMELAPNGSLELRRDRFGDVGWARRVLAGIANGLCALHEAGIVHRDLKPANVLLVGDDVPKISDFGISRYGELESDVDPNASTLAAQRPQTITATGMLLGTPYYMAPETVRGSSVHAPADVFAFGILAAEMLGGRPPFAAPPIFRILAGERLDAPIGVDGIEPEVREIVLACLAEAPEQRPSMASVRAALG